MKANQTRQLGYVLLEPMTASDRMIYFLLKVLKEQEKAKSKIGEPLGRTLPQRPLIYIKKNGKWLLFSLLRSPTDRIRLFSVDLNDT